MKIIEEHEDAVRIDDLENGDTFIINGNDQDVFVKVMDVTTPNSNGCVMYNAVNLRIGTLTHIVTSIELYKVTAEVRYRKE